MPTTKPIQMRLSEELLDRVDKARGKLSRTEFVRLAVEYMLANPQSVKVPRPKTAAPSREVEPRFKSTPPAKKARR
jgi:hypothetical protein